MALDQQYKTIFAVRDVTILTADAKNSGINIVDKLTGALYRVTSKLVIEQLYAAIEADIALGRLVSYRFEERSYERTAGLNLLVQHVGARPPDMESWMQQFCAFVYSALVLHCGVAQPCLFVARSGATMNVSVPDVRLPYAERWQFVERLNAMGPAGVSIRCSHYNPIASITRCFMLAPSPFAMAAGFIATPIETPTLLRSSVMYDHGATVVAASLRDADASATGPVIEIEEVSVKAALNKPQVAFAKSLIDVLFESRVPGEDELRATLACMMPVTGFNPYCENWDGQLLTEQFKSLGHYLWSSWRGFTTRDAFEAIWRDIMMDYAHDEKTLVDLIHRVLERNAAQYETLLSGFIDAYIVGAMRFGQALSQIDLGKIIYFSCSHKYAAYTTTVGGRTQCIWYEFVGRDEDRGTGWLYKWRPSQAFRQDRIRIQDRLRAQFLALAERYLNISRRNAAADPGSTNKKTLWVRALNSEVWVDASKLDERLTPPECDVFIKILGNAAATMGDATSGDRVFVQAQDMLMRNHFFGRLNADKRFIGTLDGVLALASPDQACQMIRGYHTIPISMSAGAMLVSEEDAALRRIGTLWREFFYERGEWALDGRGIATNIDISDWTLMYLSQMLDGEIKAALFLIWTATGRCGKTFFSEGFAEALSLECADDGGTGVYPDGYATKINNLLMTSGGRQKDGNDHSTALIKLEGKRYGLMSEGGKAGGKLDSQKVKMVHSQETLSGRRLQQNERNFVIAMVTLMVTNLAVEPDSYDTGLRRRVRIYKPKYLYMDDPDPNKPFERRADPSYNKDLRKRQSTKNALFTLLVAAHNRLQREFGGDFERVPVPPVIKRETLDMLTRYDTVYRFACKMLVMRRPIELPIVVPDSETASAGFAEAVVTPPKPTATGRIYRITMAAMKEAYLNWYHKFVPVEMQKGVQSAALDEELSIGVLDRFVELEGGFKVFSGLRVVSEAAPCAADEMEFAEYNVL